MFTQELLFNANYSCSSTGLVEILSHTFSNMLPDSERW